jgi:hypothetical protein
MKRWKKQIDELDIPYPQKHRLVTEIEDHFQNSSESDDEIFAEEALEEFISIHNRTSLLFLRRLPRPLRNCIELTLTGVPLMGLLVYLIKEKFMYQFFVNGGASMIAILAIGLLLLGREGLLFTRVLVLKEHSKENLRVDSNSVLVGSLALTVLGISSACLGLYVSITSSLANNAPGSIVLAGVAESITNIILSGSLAALILIMHYTTRKLLLHWQAPIG